MTILDDQFEQMMETLKAFFDREMTLNMCRDEFRAYREESLRGVPAMDEALLKEHPYYAALGFLGHIQFVDGAEFKAFLKSPTAGTLAALRAAKALTMNPTAGPIWVALLAAHPEAALAAVALCAMGTKNADVAKALDSFKQVK